MTTGTEGHRLISKLDELLDHKEGRSYAFKTGYYMGHLMNLADTIPEVRAYIQNLIIRNEKESI